MLTKDNILEIAKRKDQIRTKDFSRLFNVSRQYVSMLIAQLIEEKMLIRICSTKNAFYILPEYAKAHPQILPTMFLKRLINVRLEEHKILAEIEKKFPKISELKEHVRNIFTFAFSEMLNNAIEHSRSKNISLEISNFCKHFPFFISDKILCSSNRTFMSLLRNMVGKICGWAFAYSGNI